MSIAVNTFLTLALSEIRAVGAGDVVSPDDMDLALTMFNELLDFLNVNDRAIYSETFADYTLTPSLNPHTIGSGGTFNVSQRPVSIDAAALNIGGSPAVYTDIQLRDEQWYAERAVPALSTSVPTDLYYAPTWPLGKIYFWPVPSVAYSVRLWTRTVLASVALSDTFDLPPGYQAALRLTVAEKCAAHLGLQVSPQTSQMAINAREMVWGANDVIPNLITRDGGVPGGNGGWWYYQTGQSQ